MPSLPDIEYLDYAVYANSQNEICYSDRIRLVTIFEVIDGRNYEVIEIQGEEDVKQVLWTVSKTAKSMHFPAQPRLNVLFEKEIR